MKLKSKEEIMNFGEKQNKQEAEKGLVDILENGSPEKRIDASCYLRTHFTELEGATMARLALGRFQLKC